MASAEAATDSWSRPVYLRPRGERRLIGVLIFCVIGFAISALLILIRGNTEISFSYPENRADCGSLFDQADASCTGIEAYRQPLRQMWSLAVIAAVFLMCGVSAEIARRRHARRRSENHESSSS